MDRRIGRSIAFGYVGYQSKRGELTNRSIMRNGRVPRRGNATHQRILSRKNGYAYARDAFRNPLRTPARESLRYGRELRMNRRLQVRRTRATNRSLRAIEVRSNLQERRQLRRESRNFRQQNPVIAREMMKVNAEAFGIRAGERVGLALDRAKASMWNPNTAVGASFQGLAIGAGVGAVTAAPLVIAVKVDQHRKFKKNPKAKAKYKATKQKAKARRAANRRHNRRYMRKTSKQLNNGRNQKKPSWARRHIRVRRDAKGRFAGSY